VNCLQHCSRNSFLCLIVEKTGTMSLLAVLALVCEPRHMTSAGDHSKRDRCEGGLRPDNDRKANRNGAVESVSRGKTRKRF
jgi:hypothetical protein